MLSDLERLMDQNARLSLAYFNGLKEKGEVLTPKDEQDLIKWQKRLEDSRDFTEEELLSLLGRPLIQLLSDLETEKK